jgi:glutathione S-transferase
MKMAAVTLYNSAGSTCSQRVRFVLAAKGIEFEKHDLNLLAGDQLKPEYLKINPNGVVPTLVHKGTVVTDSSVIIEYLDEEFPNPERFVPADAGRRAAMRSLMRFIDEVPTPAVRVPSFNLAFISAFRGMDEQEFVAVANAKPLRKEFMLAMGRTGFSDADMAQALDRLGRSMRRMNEEIANSGGPWMMGTQLTLADIAVMPTVVRLEDIGLSRLWAGMPSIERWREQIVRHPAYAATYYPGSHVSDRYPELKARGAAS